MTQAAALGRAAAQAALPLLSHHIAQRVQCLPQTAPQSELPALSTPLCSFSWTAALDSVQHRAEASAQACKLSAAPRCAP